MDAINVYIDVGSSKTMVRYRINNRFMVLKDNEIGYRPTIACIRDGLIYTGHKVTKDMLVEGYYGVFYDFHKEIDNDVPLLGFEGYNYYDLYVCLMRDIYMELVEELHSDLKYNVIIGIDNEVNLESILIDRIKKACQDAGFNKVKCIRQSVSAMKAYRYRNRSIESGYYLVYDLGASKFDASLVGVDIEKNLFEQKDNKRLGFGGDLLDRVIAEDIIRVHKLNNRGYGETGLIDKARDIKVKLSSLDNIEFEVDNYKGSYSSEDMLNVISFYIDKTFDCCDKLLDLKGIKWGSLKGVVFVGGNSTAAIKAKAYRYLEENGIAKKVIDKIINIDRHYESKLDISMGGIKPMVSDKNYSDFYEASKNELIDYFERVQNVKEIMASDRHLLEEKCRRLQEDTFEIVLIGEYQSGKTTTFNALCDGRAISPRGKMVKTSACKTSACHLSDSSAEEYAIILWKNDRELLLSIIDILADQLRKLDSNRFMGMSKVDMIANEDIKLDLIEDHNLISQALDKEWKKYKRNKIGYGELEELKIATLIINRYKDFSRRGFLNSKKYEINRVKKYIVFPDKWNARWSRNGVDYEFDEVLFPFISQVVFHIKSPNLERLGCVITDSPGLFESSWDTEVARSAMIKANAILFLVNGEKTITLQEVKAIDEIYQLGMEHKLFFGINIRGRLKAFKKNVLPETINKLGLKGITLTEDDINIYHALLGLYGEIGKKILDESIDNESLKEFTEFVEEFHGFDGEVNELWVDICEYLQRNYVKRKDSKPLKFDVESTDRVLRESRLRLLMFKIEEMLIKNKAYDILVTNGSDYLLKVLNKVAIVMKNREEVARTTKEEIEAKLQVAKKRFEDFKLDYMDIIKCFKDDGDRLFGLSLADDMYTKVIFNNIDLLCRTCAEDLYNNKLLILKAKDEKINATVKDALTRIVTTSMSKWIEEVRSGKNDLYNDLYMTKNRSIANEIEIAWNNHIDKDDNDVFIVSDSITIPYDNILMDHQTLSSKGILDGCDVGNVFLTPFISSATGFVSSAGLYVLVGMPIIFLLALINIIPALIAGVVAMITTFSIQDLVTGRLNDIFIDQLGNEFKKVFVEKLSDTDNLKKMKLELSKNIQQLNLLHYNYYKTLLIDKEMEHNQGLDELKMQYIASENDRRELAKKSRAFREGILVPLTKDIEMYRSKVKLNIDKSRCD